MKRYRVTDADGYSVVNVDNDEDTPGTLGYEEPWYAVPEDFGEVPYLFDDLTCVYVHDIATMRDRLWEQVKAARAEKESRPAPTPFGLVQTDDKSKLRINGLVQMAEIATRMAQPFLEEFTMADNSVQQLDAQGAVDLGMAVGSYVSSVFSVARDKRDYLFNEQRTMVELVAFDPAAGWP